MLKIEAHSRFKKDFKLAQKRGYDMEKLRAVVALLVQEQPLPPKFRDHALTDSREYQGVRECHIQPDWLLVYRVDHGRMVLLLLRTGTHSDLF